MTGAETCDGAADAVVAPMVAKPAAASASTGIVATTRLRARVVIPIMLLPPNAAGDGPGGRNNAPPVQGGGIWHPAVLCVEYGSPFRNLWRETRIRCAGRTNRPAHPESGTDADVNSALQTRGRSGRCAQDGHSLSRSREDATIAERSRR